MRHATSSPSSSPPSSQAPAQAPAPRGRPFAAGNPGRRPGSQNRSTLVIRALLEEQKSALLEKAIAVAHGGDVPMLKFLLSHLLPRDRLINVELPQLESAADAVEVLGRIAAAAANGAITPNEGAALATIVNAQSKAIEQANLVKRVDALEAQLGERGAI